jgi:1-deoxy-D-xylulose-5-phosphate reductoisomerase
MKHNRVVILGSTGSIGVNTLKVIERFKGRFQVVGLTAYNNFKLIEKQIQKFSPEYVAVSPKGIDYLKARINLRKTKLLNVYEDLDDLVALKNVNTVVIAMRGSAALSPFLKAVQCGKTVAPANKEALVVAGEIIMRQARQYGAKVIPIDSEQSAIFQCLDHFNGNPIYKVYLTASGGTLRGVPKARFDRLSVSQMLKHPTWKMGDKITIDSASLMNKGFEVIEAMRLFDLTIDQGQVVIHPQSIIHSMVEFADGSVIAQMGITDMRLPIQYALTYPRRLDSGLKRMDFFKLKQLTFNRPDLKKFPSLALCMHVAQRGGTLPSVLNAADEEAVEAYLKREIRFTQIYEVVEKIVKKHKIINQPSLKQILEADQWAREEAGKVFKH